METREIQEWALAATRLATAKTGDKISLTDALNSLRKTAYDGASDSDYVLAVSFASAFARRSEKKIVTEWEDPERAEVAALNRDAMAQVMIESRMLLSPSDYNKWRPTVRKTGLIPGLPTRITCLATDGNLGIFATESDSGHSLGSYFIGHVGHFTWFSGECEMVGAPPILYSLQEKSTTPKRPKKKSLKDILREI